MRHVSVTVAGWCRTDLNLAIVGSRRQHLTVPAEAEAQDSSLHQHEVVLGRARRLGGRNRCTLNCEMYGSHWEITLIITSSHH